MKRHDTHMDQLELRRRPSGGYLKGKKAIPMDFSTRDHSNPEIRTVYLDGWWEPRRLTYHQTQERIHRGTSRRCTRCLGSGHYFGQRCQTCSGWGVNMVLRGHHDLPKST